MRLDELTGVKKFYGQATSLRMLISKLEDQGYTVLGSGKFGVTVKHPNGYVVKLYTTKDNCYSAFVEYCQTHKQNPHLPNIISKKVPVMDDIVTMVRIEELHEIDPETRVDDLFNEMINMADMAMSENFEMFWSKMVRFWFDEPEEHEVVKMLEKHRTLFETLNDLLNKVDRMGKCVFDIRSLAHNIMQRSDGTLVVTDPWFNPMQKGKF